MDKSKIWFFESTKKTEKSLVRLILKRKEKVQMHVIRNEKEGTSLQILKTFKTKAGCINVFQ